LAYGDETDGHFAPDSDEFELDAAAVAAEEASGRKEARHLQYSRDFLRRILLKLLARI
jgi:hypothetical protein